MNLMEYGRILLRRGWIMLLLAALAGAGAWFFVRDDTPIYRASQVILLQPSRSDFGLTEATRLLINPLVVYLNSEDRAQDVINERRLDVQAGELLANTTFAADQFRLTVQIDVDSPHQDIALTAAQQWGQTLIDFRNERNQLARFEDRVEAIPVRLTVGQIAPRPTIMGAAGAILGFLIGAVIVFVLEYVESAVVHRREDLERGLSLDVLATVPSFDA